MGYEYPCIVSEAWRPKGWTAEKEGRFMGLLLWGLKLVAEENSWYILN